MEEEAYEERNDQSLWIPYRVLHDIWLLCHPGMTLHLMGGADRKGGGGRTGDRWKVNDVSE